MKVNQCHTICPNHVVGQSVSLLSLMHRPMLRTRKPDIHIQVLSSSLTVPLSFIIASVNQRWRSGTFSSEFIAMKTCLESITHLGFKLQVFGIPLDSDPAHIFCDNESVVKNSTRIESTLHKKHNSIAYHYVRWNVAAGVASVSWIDGAFNLADAMTKRLTEHHRDKLFGDWTS